MFSFLHKPEFSKHDVAEAALRALDPNKKPPSDNIILRDIDCYIGPTLVAEGLINRPQRKSLLNVLFKSLTSSTL